MTFGVHCSGFGVLLVTDRYCAACFGFKCFDVTTAMAAQQLNSITSEQSTTEMVR
jgi:hypothetical protein